jgi:hypothetical protein
MTMPDGMKSNLERHNKRMLVVAPELLDNTADYARQIYTQAASQAWDVLYLALISRESDQLAVARQLATLAALTQDRSVYVSSLQLKMENWPGALRHLTQPGDLVILPDERLLISRNQEIELDIGQRMLLGTHFSKETHPHPWLSSLLFWGLSMLILGGFSYIEFSLTSILGGVTLKAALIILIAFELGAMYRVNQILA